MKKIEAILKPQKLEEVRDALHAAGAQGMTVTHVEGFGRQKGQVETYRGAEVGATFVSKVKLELVVKDGMADRLVQVILEHARSGNIGDGKIFVSDVAEVWRIRTGEHGESAV